MPTDTSLGNIGAFGMGANGQPGEGPFGFLPQAPGLNSPIVAANGQSFAPYDQSGIAGAGGESLNQMEFGGRAAGGSPAGFAPSMPGSSAGGNSGSSYLQGVVSGQNVPYNAATQSAELTNASNMNSAAEEAQNKEATDQAVAGGASGSDPSLAGVHANNEAKRTTNNANAGLSIAENANVANTAAQTQAAESLQSNSLAEQQLALAQEQAQWGQQNKQEQLMLSFMDGAGNSNNGNAGTETGYMGGQDPWTNPAGPAGFMPPTSPGQNQVSPQQAAAQQNLGNQDPTNNSGYYLPDGSFVNTTE